MFGQTMEIPPRKKFKQSVPVAEVELEDSSEITVLLDKLHLEDMGQNVPPISSTNIEETLLSSQLRYCPLEPGRDLLKDMPKSYYNSKKTDVLWSPREFTKKFPSFFSSFAVAKGQEARIGTVDFVADAESMKELLKIPLTSHSASLLVHRIGNSLHLDHYELPYLELHPDLSPIHKYVSENKNGNWKWFNQLAKDLVDEKELKQIFWEDRSQAQLASGINLNKIFYFGLVGEIEFNSSVGKDDRNTECTAPGPSHHLEGSNKKFMQRVLWQFAGQKMLVGSQVPTFEIMDTKERKSPGETNALDEVSVQKSLVCTLRSNDLALTKKVPMEDGLDMWLDNLMLGAPQTLICHQEDDYVKCNEFVKTEDLPNHCHFDARSVEAKSASFLRKIQEQVSEVGHSYWIYRAPDSRMLKIYDLTKIQQTIDNLEANPWMPAIACLLYNICQVASDQIGAETVLSMMRHFLTVFPENQYPLYAVGAIYHVLHSSLSRFGANPIYPDEISVISSISKPEPAFEYKWSFKNKRTIWKLDEFQPEDIFTLQYYKEPAIDPYIPRLDKIRKELEPIYEELFEHESRTGEAYKKITFHHCYPVSDAMFRILKQETVLLQSFLRRIIDLENYGNSFLEKQPNGSNVEMNTVFKFGSGLSIKLQEYLSDDEDDDRILFLKKILEMGKLDYQGPESERKNFKYKTNVKPPKRDYGRKPTSLKSSKDGLSYIDNFDNVVDREAMKQDCHPLAALLSLDFRRLVRQMLTAVIILESVTEKFGGPVKKSEKQKMEVDKMSVKILLKLLHNEMALLMFNIAKQGMIKIQKRVVLTTFCAKQALFHLQAGNKEDPYLKAYSWYLAGLAQSYVIPHSFVYGGTGFVLDQKTFREEEPHLFLLCHKFKRMDGNRDADSVPGLKDICIDTTSMKQIKGLGSWTDPPGGYITWCFNNALAEKHLTPNQRKFFQKTFSRRFGNMGLECFNVVRTTRCNDILFAISLPDDEELQLCDKSQLQQIKFIRSYFETAAISWAIPGVVEDEEYQKVLVYMAEEMQIFRLVPNALMDAYNLSCNEKHGTGGLETITTSDPKAFFHQRFKKKKIQEELELD